MQNLLCEFNFGHGGQKFCWHLSSFLIFYAINLVLVFQAAHPSELQIQIFHLGSWFTVCVCVGEEGVVRFIVGCSMRNNALA